MLSLPLLLHRFTTLRLHSGRYVLTSCDMIHVYALTHVASNAGKPSGAPHGQLRILHRAPEDEW